MTFRSRAAMVAKIQARLPQNSMANPTNSDFQALLLDMLDSSGSAAQSAVTAVATTGVQLPTSADYVIVTSASTSNLVVLPACADVTPGKVIKLEAGATGFGLCTGAVGDLLNNVAASAGVAKAAIPATGLAICTAVSAAETGSVAGWLLSYLSELGAVVTAIVPA